MGDCYVLCDNLSVLRTVWWLYCLVIKQYYKELSDICYSSQIIAYNYNRYLADLEL